jgi:DNA-binding NtrC family response regulator
MPTALLVNPSPETADSLARLADEAGFDARVVPDPADLWDEIEVQKPDLLVLDSEEDGGVDAPLLRRLRREFPGRVLTLASRGSNGRAPGAPLEELGRELERLRGTLPDGALPDGALPDGALPDDALPDDALPDDATPTREPGFGPLIGRSSAMREVYRMVESVAPMDCPVLLSGETGTGKELVARCIHERGARSDGAFVAVNCGAIQPTLIESELFGHVSGAFTGASRAHRGMFEQAHGGTLLLDEVTEMPLDLQVKLLRVLETGRVQRIGGEKTTEVDVRVVAATNRSPEEAIADGKLREDLYYRLSVFPIHLPPLRERDGDVELLARRFLETLSRTGGERKSFRTEALARLVEHDWPGNVRELRNVIERAWILAGAEIRAEQIRFDAADDGRAPARAELEIKVGQSIAQAERILIEATLEHVGGNKRKAAKVLGISVKTLYNRLNRYADAP